MCDLQNMRSSLNKEFYFGTTYKMVTSKKFQCANHFGLDPDLKTTFIPR